MWTGVLWKWRQKVRLGGEDETSSSEWDCCLFAQCNSWLHLIIPSKQQAGRCVDDARLDLSFEPRLHWEPTAVLNCKWTSNSSGRASEATEGLVHSGGLRCGVRICSRCQCVYILLTAASITGVLLDCFSFVFLLSLSTPSDCSHLLGMSTWSPDAVQTEACIRFRNIYLNSTNLFPRMGQIPRGLCYIHRQKDRLGPRVPAVWM